MSISVTLKIQLKKPIKSHFKIHSEKDIRCAVLQTLGGNKSKSMRLLVEDIWIRNLKTHCLRADTTFKGTGAFSTQSSMRASP